MLSRSRKVSSCRCRWWCHRPRTLTTRHPAPRPRGCTGVPVCARVPCVSRLLPVSFYRYTSSPGQTGTVQINPNSRIPETGSSCDATFCRSLAFARPHEMTRPGGHQSRRDLDSAPIGARPPTDRVGSADTHGHRPTPPRASTVASVRVPKGHLVPPCHALARPPERWNRFLSPHPPHERPNAPAVSPSRFEFAGCGDQLVAHPYCLCHRCRRPLRCRPRRSEDAPSQHVASRVEAAPR